MKKIAILTPGNLPIPSVMGGAIETLVTYLIDENEKYGLFEFHIYNTDKYIDQYKDKSYKYTYVHTIKCTSIFDQVLNYLKLILRKITGFKIPYSSIYLDKVAAECRANDYNEILIEGLPYYAWGFYKKTGIKPILHLHTDIFDGSSRNSFENLHSCKKVLCVSEYIRRQVLTIKDADKIPINVLLNCADIKQFNVQNKAKYRKESRAQLGIDLNDIVFIYAGRLNYNKGVGDIVEAFKKLTVSNAKLLIVGGSNFADSKPDLFVQSLMRESELDSRIILTGYVPHSKLHKMFSAADFYVAPSKYYEAAPLANIEANSMGLRSIISDRGGSTEYSFQNFDIVINVDCNSVQNILDAMNALLADNSQENIDSDLLAKFSVENYYRTFVHLI